MRDLKNNAACGFISIALLINPKASGIHLAYGDINAIVLILQRRRFICQESLPVFDRFLISFQTHESNRPIIIGGL